MTQHVIQHVTQHVIQHVTQLVAPSERLACTQLFGVQCWISGRGIEYTVCIRITSKKYYNVPGCSISRSNSLLYRNSSLHWYDIRSVLHSITIEITLSH